MVRKGWSFQCAGIPSVRMRRWRLSPYHAGYARRQYAVSSVGTLALQGPDQPHNRFPVSPSPAIRQMSFPLDGYRNITGGNQDIAHLINNTG